MPIFSRFPGSYPVEGCSLVGCRHCWRIWFICQSHCSRSSWLPLCPEGVVLQLIRGAAMDNPSSELFFSSLSLPRWETVGLHAKAMSEVDWLGQTGYLGSATLWPRKSLPLQIPQIPVWAQMSSHTPSPHGEFSFWAICAFPDSTIQPEYTELVRWELSSFLLVSRKKKSSHLWALQSMEGSLCRAPSHSLQDKGGWCSLYLHDQVILSCFKGSSIST